MGKVKLSKVNKTYIETFLKFYGKKINRKCVVGASLANIIYLGSAIYFFEYNILLKILFLLFAVGILISLINYLKNVRNSDKNVYLYFGIYKCFWIICFWILAYPYFKEQLGAQSLYVLILIVVIESVKVFL